MLLGVMWGSSEVNRTTRKSCELPAGCMIFSQEINGVFFHVLFLILPFRYHYRDSSCVYQAEEVPVGVCCEG